MYDGTSIVPDLCRHELIIYTQILERETIQACKIIGQTFLTPCTLISIKHLYALLTIE